jgi:hypothetical protein
MTFEAASHIDWSSFQRIVGEDSILVGYREADSHSSGMSMAQLGGLLSVDHHTPQGKFVPARPHLLEGLEDDKVLLQEEVKKYFKRLVDTGEREMSGLEQECLAAVKEFLDSGVLKGIAPNAIATIKRKGHDFPDIDNGELRDGLVAISVKGSRPPFGIPQKQLPEIT